MKELIEFASLLADNASSIAIKYFRKNPSINTKEDKSLASLADYEIERELRKLISKHYPDHNIVGEENGITNKNSDYEWIIDPIDGTLSFLSGRATFGTLIALSYKGEPILGVIEQGILKERWIGVKNGDCLCNSSIVQTNSFKKELSECIISTTGYNYYSDDKFIKFKEIASHCKGIVSGGDCYSFGLLASGFLDIIIESNLNLHDFAALIPIIESSGGIISNWRGEKLTLLHNTKQDIVAASNKAIHKIVIEGLDHFGNLALLRNME